MSTPPSLCNMPDVVARNIFNKMDFKSIQNLRKVSYDLRNRIDDIKPESHFSVVVIRVTDCNIRFFYYSKIRNLDVEVSEDAVDYEKTVESGRSIVRSRGSEKIVNGDYMELASRDFLLIFKFQKQRLYSIKFVNETEHSNHFLQFLEILKSFLALENRLLKVDVFGINAIDQKTVITALSLIDPQSIKWIRLFNSKGRNQPIEFTEIMEMEHWKTAKYFKSDFIITGVSAHNFRHFSRVEFKFRSISVEDLLDLKKNSSEPEWFRIRYEIFEGREQLFEKMGPTVRTRFDEFEWFYRMSTSDDYVLRIRLNQTIKSLKSIQFSRDALSLVPEHAVIQD